MSRLRFYFLGDPHIELEGKPVHIGRRKAVALLVYLSVTSKGHSRDTLATLFWPESGQQAARTALRRDLTLLRRTLGPEWFSSDRNSIDLNRDSGVWADVEQFQRLLDASHEQHENGEELDVLEEAVNLYRADFLTGFSLRDSPSFDDWQSLHTQSLRRDLAGALERLVQIGIERGVYGTVLEHARRWLELDPLHEGAHRGLMRLYALSGRRTDAVRQYEGCVRVLDAELGVQPEDETTTLFEAIRSRRFPPPRAAQQTRDLEEAAGAQDLEQPLLAAASVGVEDTDKPVPSNLPTQPTPFVGREQELSDILRRLQDPDCRLLTLVGPGGIGKTRLAIESARRLLNSPSAEGAFADGILFVPLQPVSTESGIVSAVAEAINFRFYSDVPPREQLLDYLRRKRMLLLLDNFEHLLASAALVGEILTAAPGVKILATSREGLKLRQEWFHPVTGMRFSGDPAAAQLAVPDYVAVRLFVRNARRAQPHFPLMEEQDHVVRICRLVEGMPLGIELAAAWLKVLPCEQIVKEIERGLDILTARHQDVPERHRSMRVLLNQSWQLLSEEEQDVLKRLSVFQGGFCRSAAADIAGASLLILANLVEKSLLQTSTAGRYQMHELLRQYGAEKLAESPESAEAAAHRAHCAYFMQLLADRHPRFYGSRQLETAQEIGGELENVRKAWQWALDHLETEWIRRAAPSLAHVCQFQSRYLEGADTFLDTARILETDRMTAERGAALSGILTSYAWFCIRVGRLDDADRALARACNLYDEFGLTPAPRLEGYPFLPCMFLALTRGDYEQATTLGEQVLRVAAEYAPPGASATPNFGMASAALAQGDYPHAKAHAEQALALAASEDNRRNMTFPLSILGQVASAEGDLQTAKQHFEAAYAICDDYGDLGGKAEHLANLAGAAVLRQEWPEARQLFARGHAIYEEIGDRGGIARTRLGMGIVAQKTDEQGAARLHYGHALAVAVDTQIVPVILSIAAVVGDFLLQSEDTETLGLRALSIVLQHPSCDGQTRQQIMESLDQTGHSSHEFDATPDTLPSLAAALQAELAVTEEPSSLLNMSIQPLAEPLTAREGEVLHLLAEGRSNPEIAEKLVVAVDTITAHTSRIYRKLDVTDRTKAVARARELGILA